MNTRNDALVAALRMAQTTIRLLTPHLPAGRAAMATTAADFIDETLAECDPHHPTAYPITVRSTNDTTHVLEDARGRHIGTLRGIVQAQARAVAEGLNAADPSIETLIESPKEGAQ